ncbi:MAG: family 78 glycoside hydrolase catalytic domain [Chitinophagaceae bacterium]|nr:family 78 glycoside hydrolase catalytic domain [Chitinophagaceae bacterium]
MKQHILSFAIAIGIICMINSAAAQQTTLKATHLRTEYKTNPVTDIANPRLSWELTSSARNQAQTAYQVIVASSPELLTPEKADLWNTEKINSNRTSQIQYSGKSLKSGTTCYWKVRSWNNAGQPGQWSTPAKWEMGLLNPGDWKASWIGNDLSALGKGPVYHLPPAPYFRKEAELKSAIRSARLYVTALGLYEFQINGKRIGKDYFTPGWTDYNKRVYYQAYDVTKDLKKGKNVLGAIITEGWYAGYLGYALLVGNPVVHNFYGKTPLLKAQIEIEYTDGRKETIITDGSWKSNQGPLKESDILNGETFDARAKFRDWDKPGFDTRNWVAAKIYPDNPDRKVEVYPGNPIERVQELKTIAVTERPGGKYIFNLGQNFAGVVRLKVKGKAGDSIVLRYGEVLFPDGSLMTENLRKARATDTYILEGKPEGESWTPQFTYHGFQYVEVSGLRSKPSPDVITGIVMTSATPEAGSLVTDNKMINQLYHNIVWTQRSNYFDIPTDCPQRDERLGWTGDAQAYIQSAVYNNDIAAFFNKWLVDLNDAQRKDGTYPIYAPAPNLRVTDTYSPGWSDAGIICTYTIYHNYGDTSVVNKFWPGMVRYMKFLEDKSKGKYYFPETSFEDIDPKGGFGDWLSVGKKTPPDMLATMYYAYNARMMAEMARATGNSEDETYFTEVMRKVNEAFIKHYTGADGKFITNAEAYGNGDGYVDGNMGFGGHTQTAYANAVYMLELGFERMQKAGDWLAELVHANDDKLTTGFLGVKPLLPALSATGHSDVAYKLLLSEHYPSWGFEVVNGANTIWERWNSYIKGKGFESNAEMNSFNHYTFGSVNEWLFGNMAGIKAGSPGYNQIIIRPEIAPEKINIVKGTYHSIHGDIVSSWKKSGNQLLLNITIPVNTKAEIHIPAASIDRIKESGLPVSSNKDLKPSGGSGNYVTVEAGSGVYHFVVNN